MIRQEKKWMTYTFLNRKPGYDFRTAHLFSLANNKITGMKRVAFPTMIVSLKKPDFLQRWSKSARYKINRAEKEGLAVDRGAFLLDDILKLFSLTAASKRLSGYTPDHFSDISSHISCSAVYFDGVMLCGHIWLIDKDEKRAILYVSASNRHDENSDTSLTGRAHYFLLWQDGLFFRQEGIETIDLMGYDPASKDPQMQGINQWKAATHGRQEVLYHYYPWWFYILRRVRSLLPR